MAENKKKKRKKRKSRKRKNVQPIRNGWVIILAIVLLIITIPAVRSITAFLSSNENKPVQYTQPIGPMPRLKNSTLNSAAFRQNDPYMAYDDGITRGILGADISSHQGWIDWNEAASVLDFAIVRVGYRGYEDGSVCADSGWEDNMNGAESVGLELGAYFFSQAITVEEAVEEAEFVISQLAGRQLKYPVYFDWEPVQESSARTNGISNSTLTACADAFCKTIEQAGYDSGVYFNLSQAYSNYDLIELRYHKMWLAEYNDMPSFPYKIDCWQYSCTGSCPGFSGQVDLNLYFIEDES